jgi:hypothetical protein
MPPVPAESARQPDGSGRALEYPVALASFLATKSIAVGPMTMVKFSNGLIRCTSPTLASGGVKGKDPNMAGVEHGQHKTA